MDLIEVPTTGPPVARAPVLQHECHVSGLRLVAIPPGKIEVNLVAGTHVLDINMRHHSVLHAVNSDRMKEREVHGQNLGWYPPEISLKVLGQNDDWGAIVEIDATRADKIEGELLDGRHLATDFFDYRRDSMAASLARYLIHHLRRPEIDPLFVEGLGLAMVARGASSMHQIGFSETPDQTGPRHPRILRALDYIEAHLGTSLSVGEIASIAAMSPGHFARCFKRTTGQSVWKYVESHRCERAKEMLLSTPFPISQVAYACGFSSQAHLTDSMRRRFGATPGQIRSTR